MLCYVCLQKLSLNAKSGINFFRFDFEKKKTFLTELNDEYDKRNRKVDLLSCDDDDDDANNSLIFAGVGPFERLEVQ